MVFLLVNVFHHAILAATLLLQFRVTNQMPKSLDAKLREGRAVVDPVMNEKKSHGNIKNYPENIRHGIMLSTKIRKPKYNRDLQSAIFLKRLEEQAELYPKKIEAERLKICKLNELIEATQKKILIQRSRLDGGIEVSQESSKTVAKQVCVYYLNKTLSRCAEGRPRYK